MAITRATINYRDALNTAGFAACLAKYPDHDSLDYNIPEDQRKISERFEAFAAAREAAPLMREFYRRELFADTGVKPSDHELRHVDIYLDSVVLTGPSEVINFRDDIARWHEILRELKALHGKYTVMGGKIKHDGAEAEASKANAGYEYRKATSGIRLSNWPAKWWCLWIGAIVRFLFCSKEEISARQFTLKEWADKKDDAANKLKAFTAIQVKTDDLLEEQRTLRRQFIAMLAIFRTVREEISTGVANKLQEMVANGYHTSMETLEEAQSYFERLDRLGTEYGTDYLAGIPDRMQFQQDLDIAIKGRLYEDLKRRLVSQKPNRIVLSGVELVVKKELARATLGSRKNDQARETVVNVLRSLYNDNSVSHAHKLLLRPHIQ